MKNTKNKIIERINRDLDLIQLTVWQLIGTSLAVKKPLENMGYDSSVFKKGLDIILKAIERIKNELNNLEKEIKGEET
jgi:predicted DNA-binding transcriptional regulator